MFKVILNLFLFVSLSFLSTARADIAPESLSENFEGNVVVRINSETGEVAFLTIDENTDFREFEEYPLFLDGDFQISENRLDEEEWGLLRVRRGRDRGRYGPRYRHGRHRNRGYYPGPRPHRRYRGNYGYGPYYYQPYYSYNWGPYYYNYYNPYYSPRYPYWR